MIKKYKNFKDIEKEVEGTVHATVYKYRDWNNDLHKRIISDQEVWFAHPHSLNDPDDVRPPYNFVIGDIDWELAKNKIREAGRIFEPHLSNEDLEEQVGLRVLEIKNNPSEYFHRNRGKYILDESNYDQLGVFSCCTSEINELMWTQYANKQTGFALGFKTVELSKSLNCTFGYISYDDTPVDYNIFGVNRHIMEKEIFQKLNKWKSEEEFRFITAGIGLVRERASIFPANTISELVLGRDVSSHDQDEIIASALIVFPNIELYKIMYCSNGLEKLKLV
jgi:hypothetical protein